MEEALSSGQLILNERFTTLNGGTAHERELDRAAIQNLIEFGYGRQGKGACYFLTYRGIAMIRPDLVNAKVIRDKFETLAKLALEAHELMIPVNFQSLGGASGVEREIERGAVDYGIQLRFVRTNANQSCYFLTQHGVEEVQSGFPSPVLNFLPTGAL
jgi:hypothetical protein